MWVAGLFIVLFILQLVFFVLAIVQKSKVAWKTLFSIEISSLVAIPIVIIFALLTADKFGWYTLSFIVFAGWAILPFLIMLVVSIIVRAVKRNKLNHISYYVGENGTYLQENHKPAILKVIGVVVILLVATLSIEVLSNDISLEKQQKKYDKDVAKAKVAVVDYLNQKYGDGNFSVKDVDTPSSLFTGSPDMVSSFIFTMTTDYMKDDFEVTINRDLSDITDYEFLEKYYKEKQGVEDLEKYIGEYKIDKLNKGISKNFNSTIGFVETNIDIEKVECNGKIPTIDELSENVKLIDPRFDINEDIKSYDDLTEYLEDLTRYYITEISKEDIQYRSYTEYFRYKFDFVSLGDEDYTDQYNGYGGYVMSGDYKYSDEKGHYEKINADTIVRIYNTRTIAVYTLDEILNPTE